MGPEGKTLEAWKEGADQAIYLRGGLDVRQGRLDGGQALLGDGSIKERAMTVPAGSVVLKHDDIVHRRSRGAEGAKYRPMFGLGAFTRTAEPEPGQCLLSSNGSQSGRCLAPTVWSDTDLAVGAPKPAVANCNINANFSRMFLLKMQKEWRIAPEKRRFSITKWPFILQFEVWESLMQWHLGHGCGLPATIRDSQYDPTVAELETRLMSSTSEVERVGSAYTLAAKGEVEILAGAMSGSESARRAACWGFGASGPAAISALLPLLADDDQQVVAHAANALGHAVGNASSQALRSSNSTLDLNLQDAISQLVSAAARADALIDTRLAGVTEEQRQEMTEAIGRGGRGYDGKVYGCEEPMDLSILGLRQTVMAVATALAAMARRLRVVAGSGEICSGTTTEQLLAALRDAANHADLGGIFPTHLMPGTTFSEFSIAAST